MQKCVEVREQSQPGGVCVPVGPGSMSSYREARAKAREACSHHLRAILKAAMRVEALRAGA